MRTSAKTQARAEMSEVAGPIELLRERELQQIIETVLRLAKKIGVPETEVHVDEAADALTRFANNAIHQNVAEHGLTVSVRTVRRPIALMKIRCETRLKGRFHWRRANRKIRSCFRCREHRNIHG
jgi:hypothetical protein